MLHDTEKAKEMLMHSCSRMLEAIGEDTAREGLVNTPDRVARAMLEATAGYKEDPEAILRGEFRKDNPLRKRLYR